MTLQLYTHPNITDHWIGTDRLDVLYQWPRAPRGWLDRVPYSGDRRQLVPEDPAAARGTRWPGTSGGRLRVGAGDASMRLTVSIPRAQHSAASWLAKRRGQKLSAVVREAIEFAISYGDGHRDSDPDSDARRTLTVRLPEGQHRATIAAAKKREQSVSAFVCDAIKLAVTRS